MVSDQKKVNLEKLIRLVNPDNAESRALAALIEEIFKESANDLSEVGSSLITHVATNLTKSNSVFEDTGLLISDILPSTTYALNLLLHVHTNSPIPGVKVRFTGSDVDILWTVGAPLGDSPLFTSNGEKSMVLTEDDHLISLFGIVTSTTGGILKLQAAQRMSGGTETVIEVDSWMKLTRIK